MVPAKTKLVKIKGIKSIYFGRKSLLTGKPKRLDVKYFGEGALVRPEMAKSLEYAKSAVEEAGGNFFVIDLFRSWGTQAKARSDYDNGIKDDFVALPGRSFHNAGSAVDVDVRSLDFPGVPKNRWLSTFWDIVRDFGFEPIIKIPDLAMSECWHFDFVDFGWSIARLRGDYPEVAKAMVLDAGRWSTDVPEEKVKKMFVQSQLYRRGRTSIGEIDGHLGPKTMRALNAEGVFVDPQDIDSLVEAVISL